jgi:hypothetical protein
MDRHWISLSRKLARSARVTLLSPQTPFGTTRTTVGSHESVSGVANQRWCNEVTNGPRGTNNNSPLQQLVAEASALLRTSACPIFL